MGNSSIKKLSASEKLTYSDLSLIATDNASSNVQNLNIGVKLRIYPKFLWIFITAFCMALVASNWFDPRQISIFGLNTGAGSIVFPFTYLFADVLTEVYGYKKARIAIWLGFLFNIFFLAYGQFTLHYLYHDAHQEYSLSQFLKINDHIIIAAFLSYFAGESVNPYLMAKLKIAFGGKYIGFRFLISTLIAYFFDEIVYAPIAFHGSLNLSNLIYHMLDSWVFMVTIEVVLLPLFINLAKHIKKLEKLDIYDTKTNFNIFNFSSSYKESENKYKDN